MVSAPGLTCDGSSLGYHACYEVSVFCFFFILSDEEVRCHMVNYLSEVRGLTPEIDDMLQVCQLFVHCKEVRSAWSKIE